MKYIIKESDIHGVGCFATQDIEKGEIVAYEPYFKFEKSHTDNVLIDYYWALPANKLRIIINGLGNYCNHKDENNIQPILSNININDRLIKFVALKNIKKDEELYNNYGSTYWKVRKYQKLAKEIQEISKKFDKLQTLLKKNGINPLAEKNGK